MTNIDLWEARKILPGISEGEFTPWEIETHNLKFIPLPEKPVKVDDSQWTKKRIKEELKVLRQQCYEYVNEHDEWARTFNSKRHEWALRKIREYTYRLRGVSNGSNGEIGQPEIQRAKESPIQDYLVGWKLRQAGATLVGKCPLHPEKTGSFTIYLRSNTWWCYSCSSGTDCIDLVMKLNNLTFIEAVKKILSI